MWPAQKFWSAVRVQIKYMWDQLIKHMRIDCELMVRILDCVRQTVVHAKVDYVRRSRVHTASSWGKAYCLSER
jgi:hypothetical protein